MSISSAPPPDDGAPPRGVMDADYARGRRDGVLTFRYRCRALEAARAYRRLGPRDAQRPRILDLGAAEGRTLAHLCGLLDAPRGLGIEYAPALVAAAPPLPAHVALREGDATQPHPDVAPGSWDLVTALAVLEHLDEPVDLLRQARRALRPGGLLVASCPAPHWDRISGRLGLHRDAYHAGDVDGRRFRQLAREAGLTVLETVPFMWAPVGFLPYLGVAVSPRFAASVDALVRLPHVLDATFVNQRFVARAV
ncbi:MAG: class I SAM-dependent methyltransferase [Acidobacteriota bacterium]